MKNPTLILILAAAAVVIAVILIIVVSIRRGHSKKLKDKYGSEYDLQMGKKGSRRKNEAALKERGKRVGKLDIRTLNEDERERYRKEWLEIKSDFVDDPQRSIKQANKLITEVMIARGFPVADFEQRAADLSVMYPKFVASYRNANAIALKNENETVSTEEQRQALVSYQSMFGELLGTMKDDEAKLKKGK
jgi:hypothetical protein